MTQKPIKELTRIFAPLKDFRNVTLNIMTAHNFKNILLDIRDFLNNHFASAKVSFG